MRKQLLLLLFSLFAVVGFARTVTGVVTQKSDNLPIIGATVMVEGTQRGTATDFDGRYTIDVQDTDVLNFSYVGMESISLKVGSQTTINVEMAENAQVLDEVVVTAMGQTQEKKKLNFAVQSLDGDLVTAGSSTDITSTLQGKVAGLQVGTTGGSPNSSSQIIIRAISSVNQSQSNEPLIVLDGMPIRGKGTSLADINPNDIANMSILKGAAASALYGQEASNGVIMITTKSGKDGKVTVNASGGWEISNAVRVPKMQSRFVGGSKGFYVENSVGGWGPMLNADDRVYDNVGEFLGTGFLQKYDVSVSGGNEQFRAYASASYSSSDGIIPEDYKKQLNVFAKGEFNPSDKVKIMLSVNLSDSKARAFYNSLTSARASNMSTIYGWAINKNMADYQTIEGYPNWSNRYDHWENLTDADRVSAVVSPYFSRYNDKSESENTRMMINGQISYEPIEGLVLTGKLAYDKSYSASDGYEVPRFQPSDFNNPNDEALADYAYKYGSYSFDPSRGSQFTANFLATYQKTFAEDYTLNLLYGMEYKETNGWDASLAGQNFLLGGDFYSFQNVDPSTLTMSSSSDYYTYLNHSKTNKYGYFGEIRFDYKGMAQLSVTGRYDGSSTLAQVDATYFYPSVTAGVIFSELFNLRNDWFSYGKVRGNWAKVGKDCPAYLFTDTYKSWSTFPDGGYGIDPTTSRAITLEPEMTSTWEVGADLRFFDSRTRLDVAYYSTTVDNQIVSVRVSPASGTILQTRNEGTVENYGVEITLGQDILRTKDFSWTATANFSLNRGRLKSLPDGVTEIAGTNYGGTYPCAFLGGSTTAIIGKDYLRDPNGNIVVNEQGYPVINDEKNVLIGNREPDFLLGLGSMFTWKDLSLSFMFDGRCGGDVANITATNLMSNGMHHLYDKYRNREIVFKGVVANADGTYSPNTTPVILDQNFINTYYVPVSSNFIEDGSYIRLSYVTLAYDFTRMLSKNCPVKGLSASVTGRNLFLLTKYSGSDPQVMQGVNSGTGSMGIDRYAVPNTRSFNLTLKATF